jgi:diguanylate cyclase (GGDEF)-like protein
MGLAMLLLYVVVLYLLFWCSRLSRRQRRLDALSLYDSLTGLLVGRVFERERWPAAIRASSPVAFLYVDLDDLKARNKSEGDKAGDKYILQAAKRLERRRGVDQVFRLHNAGDEFGILVLGDSAMRAGKLADLLVADLKNAGISASIGAACTASLDHQIRASVYDAAERAMQSAKARKGCAVSRVIE